MSSTPTPNAERSTPPAQQEVWTPPIVNLNWGRWDRPNTPLLEGTLPEGCESSSYIDQRCPSPVSFPICPYISISGQHTEHQIPRTNARFAKPRIPARMRSL